MSATLTWASSGGVTKTGTTVGACFTDLKNAIDSKAGDSTFYWEVAASSLAATPYYLWLRRKDGSNGRILYIDWESLPAGNNSAILDANPTTATIYVAWFPNGTAATPSNLTASSGSISGNDTNCVKVSPGAGIGAMYGASVQHFYFDSQEAMYFCSQNPASANIYCVAAGDILVDAADNAYGATFGTSTSSLHNWGVSASIPLPWQSGPINAGVNTASVRCNYNGTNKLYFNAFTPTGSQFNQAAGPANILENSATTQVWFVPCSLLGQTKGEGMVLKFRQFGWGPPSVGPLAIYNTTGPVVAARQLCLGTSGSNAAPWLTNNKL